jgi:hypothetical protein
MRIQGAIETGYTEPKFFPAEAAGGANYLKSVSSPIPGRAVLPDRRHLHHHRRQLLDLAECRLRRRLLDHTVRRPRSTRLGTHHRTSHRRVKALTPALNRI